MPQIFDAKGESANSGWSAAVIAIILFSILIEFVTLDRGHDWGGDFSLYLMHARNIATGHSYGDTGFVINPINLGHSPSSYPPLYPLMISPLYRIWGLDYAPFKILNLCFFAIALWFVYLLALRAGLSARSGALLLLIVGTSPMQWSQRNAVLPDRAYLMFTVAALWWYIRSQSMTLPRWVMGVIAGGLCGAAYSCHSLGLTLIVALCLVEFFRNRITPYLVGMGFTLLAILLIDHQFAKSAGDYFKMFDLSLSVIVSNLASYAHALSHVFFGLHKAVQTLLTMMAVGLSLKGIWETRRSPAIVIAAYVLACFTLLVLWPAASGDRYILSVVPLVLMFAFLAAQSLIRTGNALRFGLIAAFALALLAEINWYLGKPWQAKIEGVEQPEFQALAQNVKQNVPPRDLVVFWNPRVLLLYAGGQATTYAPERDSDTNWKQLIAMGARYIAVKLSYPDDHILAEMAQTHASSMHLIYDNSDYVLYKLTAP